MELERLWSDYWQLVVGLAGGALVTIAVAVWQRQPKTLDYAITNDVRMLSAHASTLRSKLTMDYDGVPLKDPRIVTIRLTNTGKKAIVSNDYDTPITIHYERNSPFSANLIACSPKSGLESLEPLGDPDPDDEWSHIVDFRYQPRLLNPGEWFEVQLVSDGEHGKIAVDCRFVDQTRPMRAAPTSGDEAVMRYAEVMDGFVDRVSEKIESFGNRLIGRGPK